MRRLRSGNARALTALAVVASALLLPATGATAAPKAPAGFFGVAANENRPSNTDIDRMGRGKVGILRLNINWADIEPSKPRGSANPFQFAQLDRVVGRAAQNNITLLPILYGTPRWMSKNSATAPIRTSGQRAEWQRFVRAMVNRYGPGGTYWQGFQFLFPGSKIKPIRNWQVWNEPTTRQFFIGTSKRNQAIPGDYAELLRITAPVIRQEDPGANIVTAGVFGTPHLGKGLDSRRFFRSLFAIKGIGRHFDAIAIHPYAAEWRFLKIQALWAVRELRKSGLRKKLWITEVGWPTAGRKNDFQRYLQRSKKSQASTMSSIFTKLLKRRKAFNLEKVIWFTYKDNPDLGPEFEKCNLCKFAGMFDQNNNPKPSWYVYTRFTRGDP